MTSPADCTPYLNMGLRIAAYRSRRGLLQRELAAEMNIDPATLSKLEQGKVRARQAQAVWLSEHANIAMHWWGYA